MLYSLCSSLCSLCKLPCFSAANVISSRYANLYTFGLDAHWLTATYGELAYSVAIVGSIYVRILSAVLWGRAS